jgi:hypothetical protein
MFLDEKLYVEYTTKIILIESGKDYENIMNMLFRICEDDWKPKCNQFMTDREIKVQVDRAFRSFDIFVERIVKEEYPFADLVTIDTYRKVFMENEKLREWYKSV